MTTNPTELIICDGKGRIIPEEEYRLWLSNPEEAKRKLILLCPNCYRKWKSGGFPPLVIKECKHND